MVRMLSDRPAKTSIVRGWRERQGPCRRRDGTWPRRIKHTNPDTCVQSQSEREAAFRPWAVAGNEDASPSEWGEVQFLWGGQAAARPGYLFAVTEKERRTVFACLMTARNLRRDSLTLLMNGVL